MVQSDRYYEFDDILIKEFTQTLNIKCSLGQVGFVYNNAMAKTTYRIFKFEFTRNQSLETRDYIY